MRANHFNSWGHHNFSDIGKCPSGTEPQGTGSIPLVLLAPRGVAAQPRVLYAGSLIPVAGDAFT